MTPSKCIALPHGDDWHAIADPDRPVTGERVVWPPLVPFSRVDVFLSYPLTANPASRYWCADNPLRPGHGAFCISHGEHMIQHADWPDVIRCIKASYRFVYEREAATMTRARAAAAPLNRPSSDGEFGIWGHPIDDLVLEALHYREHPHQRLLCVWPAVGS